jgi:hypothetical protein
VQAKEAVMNTSATFVLVHGKQKGDSVDFAKTFWVIRVERSQWERLSVIDPSSQAGFPASNASQKKF